MPTKTDQEARVGDLDARQTVPLAQDDAQRLREAAARLNIRPAALARVCILDGLGRLDALAAAIDAEREATRERRSRSGAENRRLGWQQQKGK